MIATAVQRSCRRAFSQILSHGGTSTLSQSGSVGVRGVRHKTTVQFATRPDLPKLAYRSWKGEKSPGVVFLPDYACTMNGQKAQALEEYCRELGHSYLGFDYTGHGLSEGVLAKGTVGAWKKDAMFALDELTEGPQILVGAGMGGWLMLLAAMAYPKKTAALVGISTAADHVVRSFHALPLETRKECEEKGEWRMPSSHSEDSTASTFSMEFLREAEDHCVLQCPIPVLCPVRLIHGLRDEDVPWHVSVQVAERLLSPDVNVTLRREGRHRMADKDDIKLMNYAVRDLMDLHDATRPVEPAQPDG